MGEGIGLFTKFVATNVTHKVASVLNAGNLIAFNTPPFPILKPFISYALATDNKLATNALVCAFADKGVCQNADTTSKLSSFSSQYGCVKWGLFVGLGLNVTLQIKQRLLPTIFAAVPHF